MVFKKVLKNVIPLKKISGNKIAGYFFNLRKAINSFPQNTYENTVWFQCLYKNYRD
jgi:hypothetical protein